MAYHIETPSNTLQRYFAYEKEMYSIMKTCRQWKHYILGKETIMHTNHMPLQFMQT